MHTKNVQPKVQSFIHGFMMPFPSMNSLEKQVEIELEETSGKANICCFAIGHMIIAYPVIIAVGFLFYKLIEITRI